MRVYYELDLDRFEAWSGAVDTLDRIRDEGKTRLLEQILEDTYPDGMEDTELNDLLWFEPDVVYSWLGMKTDEEIEQERSEREAKINALREMMVTDDPSVFCNLWIQDCEYDCHDCPLFDADDCEEATVLTIFRENIIQKCNEYISELDEEDE